MKPTSTSPTPTHQRKKKNTALQRVWSLQCGCGHPSLKRISVFEREVTYCGGGREVA